MGEVLISILALSIAALFCLRKKLAEKVQILMAVILFGGIALGILAAVLSPNFGKQVFEPPFSPDQNSFAGVFTIIALAPWAYVGFESICHSAGEFSFSHKKSPPFLYIFIQLHCNIFCYNFVTKYFIIILCILHIEKALVVHLFNKG